MKSKFEKMRIEGKEFRKQVNLPHFNQSEGKFSYSQVEKAAFADAVGIPLKLVEVDQKSGDLILK